MAPIRGNGRDERGGVRSFSKKLPERGEVVGKVQSAYQCQLEHGRSARIRRPRLPIGTQLRQLRGLAVAARKLGRPQRAVREAEPPRRKMQIGAGLGEAPGQRLDPAVNHQGRRGRYKCSGQHGGFGPLGRGRRVRPTQFVNRDASTAHVELGKLRRADVQHPAGTGPTGLGRDIASRKIDAGPRPFRVEPLAEFAQRNVLQHDLTSPSNACSLSDRGLVGRGPVVRSGVQRQPAHFALPAEIRGEPGGDVAPLADRDLQSGVAENHWWRAVSLREDDLGSIHHDAPHAQPRGEPAFARGFGFDGPTGRQRGPCRAGEQAGEERRDVVLGARRGGPSGRGGKTEARLQTVDAPEEEFAAPQRLEIERKIEPLHGQRLAGRAQVPHRHVREPDAQAPPERQSARPDVHLGAQPGFQFAFEHRDVALAGQKPAESGQGSQSQTEDGHSRDDQPPPPTWAAAVLRGGRAVRATGPRHGSRRPIYRAAARSGCGSATKSAMVSK